MMNEEGLFIGQLCHIEAAEPGGERFNIRIRAVEVNHAGRVSGNAGLAAAM
jgi:hypothetical protein